LIVSGTVRPGFSSAFSQRIDWLAITRQFATALARLLNAFQASSIGKLEPGSFLARFVLASPARSVSELIGLPVNKALIYRQSHF
jgi:hypothetical protein